MNMVSADDKNDDEDDRILLSQLIKKRRGAEPVPNGEPKKGQQDVQANSVGPLGDHPPERPPVNRGDPEASAGQRAGASPQLKKVANLVKKKKGGYLPIEGGRRTLQGNAGSPAHRFRCHEQSPGNFLQG